MIVAVIGSRDYQPLDQVRAFVRGLPRGTVLISGGARGVDMEAAHEARRTGLPNPIVIRPDYKRLSGWYAPTARNSEIVQLADSVVAFWSRSGIEAAIRHDRGGTWDVICKAMVARKPLRIFASRCERASDGLGI